MRILCEDFVVIQKGNKPGEPCVLTVNCPDRTGLACDICRTVLDFGLDIVKADISIDGIWCYIILWVSPSSTTANIRWKNLKNRLLSSCPSYPLSINLHMPSLCSSSPKIYLLKFFCLDRRGLLHDVTKVLCELDLTIQRVKVTTTPDERVLDLFFITDNVGLLNTQTRKDEVYEQLHTVLGESCISCELLPVEPESDATHCATSLPPEIGDELFRLEPLYKERERPSKREFEVLEKANVVVDNSFPSYTLLQIHCLDHKGILYDIMRTFKDCNIQIAYGRFSENRKGHRDLDLFIQQNDGKKMLDLEKQSSLVSHLKAEMLHPLRVIIADRGPDTVLIVANPVEISGSGRPRVFYDVTRALKMLGICIFSAEIGRHFAASREWEVYRFLLDDDCAYHLSHMDARCQIVDKVRRTLMGW